jgi:membrane-associated phospholipid phosphatase
MTKPLAAGLSASPTYLGGSEVKLDNLAAQIQVTFVSLLAAAAWFRPLPRPPQLMVSTLALIAVSAIALAQLSRHSLNPEASSILHDWLPLALLLVPYWQVGRFVTKSDPHTESRLAAFNRVFFRALGIRPASVSISLAVGVYLQLAYVMVYLLIPLGLGALYLIGLKRFVNSYWIVVLTSTYVCLAITPFVRAMPPRLLGDYEKFRMPPSRVEILNQWILRRGSIQVITFPSAHVASSLAAALILLRLEPWVGLIFLAIAFSIIVATVVGGYHYAAEVLLALVAAMVVFVATRSMLKPS